MAAYFEDRLLDLLPPVYRNATQLAICARFCHPG